MGSSSKKADRKRYKRVDPPCTRFFLSQDDFRTPVDVSYNEESSSNTVCGGFLSLLLRLLIFAFAIQKFFILFSRHQNAIVETASFMKFPSTYKLKDSEFYMFSQVLDKDFDNDSNPYLKMKLFIYTN